VVSRIDKIALLHQQGELEPGKAILITNLQLGEEKGAKIENNRKLSIPRNSQADIVVFYPEVRQKNTELAHKEKDLVDLVTELTDVITKNNQEVVPQAQKLGLKLPTIPLESLKYFQEVFFKDLDDKLPLASPFNQKIMAENEIVRRKKEEGIKKNIYQIYHKNLKKLENYQKNGPSTPDSELEKLKNQVIEIINQVLINKDNLRKINLSALEGGKYLNWEEDLAALSQKEEVTAYRDNFLAVLQKSITQADSEEDPSRKQSNSIRLDLGKIDKALSLPEARKIAKRLIIDLFSRYGIENVKTIWLHQGSLT
jgi:hypothetical protein